MNSSINHNNYFLVSYDDHHGNIGDEHNEVIKFLKDNNFCCAAGYWGMPWLFVDINNKIYLPGRPGVSYGKVIGNHTITFEDFKTIFDIFEKYEKQDKQK